MQSMPSQLRLISALLLFSCVAGAQSFRGSITGTIQDPSGAAVPSAVVSATETATNVQHQTTTNPTGGYLVGDLPPGTYQIAVSCPGFKAAKSGDLVVTAQSVQHFDVTLQVGETTESILVEATAPTVNMENGGLEGLVSRKEMLDIPSNSRSTFSFLYLNSFSTTGGGSFNSIGGLRGEDTNYTLDGVSSNNNVFGGQSGNQFEMSLEGVREMKILASNNSAEFAAVATVLVASRSGENQFHGSGFYQTHNYDLNAANYFTHSNPSGTIDRQYGGSFGGPVIIPKLYDGHNKTFFFFNWERVNAPGGANVTANVPTDDFRAGNFSSLSTKIIDPTTGSRFEGNIIPESRLNPVALKIQEILLPHANNYNGKITNDFKAFNPSTSDDNRYQIRLDENLSTSDTLSGRLAVRPTSADHQISTSYPDLYQNKRRTTYNAYLSETHIFTPSMLNEFRLGYSRDHQTYYPQQDGNALLKQFGITDTPSSTFPGMPTIKISNFTTLKDTYANFATSEIFELLDNFTLTRGRHQIKMGVLERYNRPNQSFEPADDSDYGTMQFSGFATNYSYADFLLGIPKVTTHSTRAPNAYERWLQSGAYVQDDFRLTPKLTLNFGLRWEYQQPPKDLRDFRENLDLSNGYIVVPTEKQMAFFSPYFPAVPGVETAAQAGMPSRSLLNGHWTDFAPRFSFAWQALPKTVVRGGYGIFYSPLVSTLTAFFEGGPFQSSQTYLNSITKGVPLIQLPNTYAAKAGQANGPSSINAVDPNLRTPYVQQWNLTLEREVMADTVVRASYRGFQSVRLPQTIDWNAPAPSADPANQNVYRYPQYAYIFLITNGGNQKLNAMDLSLERKMTKGLTFQAQYTLAKNLSNVGDDATGNFGEANSLTVYTNRKLDNANTSFQPRQRFILNSIYELPFGRGKHFGGHTAGVPGALIGGWELSAIWTWQTGQFFTPVYTAEDVTNNREFALGITRPDCIANPNSSNPNVNNWVNGAAFAVPAAGTYGNCGRGTIVGPGIANLNLGLMKNIAIKEFGSLQLRLTATNALNHPQFDAPQANNGLYPYIEVLDNTDYGLSSTLNSRSGQSSGNRALEVGLRFSF